LTFVIGSLLGILTAILLSFTSLFAYAVLKSEKLESGHRHTILNVINLLILTFTMFISSNLINGYTIVGNINHPDNMIWTLFFRSFLFMGTVGLTGILIDLYFIEEIPIRFFALFGGVIGFFMTIAIYSSLSELYVIILALICRLLMSFYLHGLSKKPISNVASFSLSAIFISVIAFTCISFLGGLLNI